MFINKPTLNGDKLRTGSFNLLKLKSPENTTGKTLDVGLSVLNKLNKPYI